MKNKLFFITLMMITLSLMSCEKINNEEVLLQKTYSVSESADEIICIGEKTELLDRLKTINDSIYLSCIGTQSMNVPNISTRSQLGEETLTADVKGFYEGFKYGWSKGRTIFGKFATATLSAVTMSVAYSAVIAVAEIGITALFCLSTYPTGVPTIHAAIETGYNQNSISAYTQHLNSTYTNLIYKNTKSEFQMAIAHNIVLDCIQKNNYTINSKDSDNLSNLGGGLLTPMQQTFFQSANFQAYYNSIPGIISGSDTFDNYCESASFGTLDEVMDLYMSGLRQIETLDAGQLINGAQELCHEYISVISSVPDMNSEIKKNIICAFYTAPLSAIYWTSVSEKSK